ncbi:MAG: DUF2335 domain-containing protein [Magnetococcus sp. YQC-5]
MNDQPPILNDQEPSDNSRQDVSNNSVNTNQNDPIHSSMNHAQEIIHALQHGDAAIYLSQTEMHLGLIPHPRIVSGWEEILPGAADRILSMSESSLSADILLKKRSQNFTFITRIVGQIVVALCMFSVIWLIREAIQANSISFALAALTLLGTFAYLIITGRGKALSNNNRPTSHDEHAASSGDQ